MENQINIKLSLMRKMSQPNAMDIMRTIMDRVPISEESISYIPDSLDDQLVEEISIIVRTQIADAFLDLVNNEYGEVMCTNDYVFIGQPNHSCVTEKFEDLSPSNETADLPLSKAPKDLYTSLRRIENTTRQLNQSCVTERFEDLSPSNETADLSLSKVAHDFVTSLRRMQESKDQSNQSCVTEKFENLSPSNETADLSLSQSLSTSQSNQSCATENFEDLSLSQNLVTPLRQSEKRTHSNRDLEFYFNKPIGDDDEDAIIMFLENRRKSGGGDIEQFELDTRRKMLMVKYCSDSLKRRVLKKCKELCMQNCHFRFQDYTFSANEPFDSLVFPPDLKTLILKRFRLNEDKENVRLFAENLVTGSDETEDENDVEFIHRSNLFKECFFIRFKNEFQMDRVVKRLKGRPTLHGQRIEALPAILSNTCVIITPPATETREKISTELMELYFTNKKRSGVSCFEHLYNRDSYTLIRFDSEANAMKLLDKKHIISNQEVIVEYLYNLDMIKGYNPDMNETHVPVVVRSERSDDKLERSQDKPGRSQDGLERSEDKPERSQDKLADIVKKTFTNIEHPVVKVDKIVEKVKFDTPEVVVDFSRESNARCLFYWNSREVLGKLLNASVSVKDWGKKTTVTIRHIDEIDSSMSENEYRCFKQNWSLRMEENVQEFLGRFKWQTLDHEEMLISDNLRCDKDKVVIEESSDRIEILGFKEPVENLLRQIEEIKQQVVTEDITNLNLTQLRMLYVNKFISSMKTKHPELDIRINIKLVQVQLTGNQRQVNDAIATLQDIISKMKMRSRSFEPIMLQFFSAKEKFFVDLIKARDLQCVLEILADQLNVYSTSESKINDFLSYLDDDLKIMEFDLSIVEDKPKLKELCTAMDSQPDLVYKIEGDNIRLCGFNDTCEYFYNQLIVI